MMGRADPAVRAAIIVTGCLAVLVFAVFAALGHTRAGLALDLGLVIGAANGPLIQRSVQVGARFGILSFGRLLALSIIGVALGLLLGIGTLWLVLVGMAAAQLVLAGAGAWRMMTG
jgi:hypothetical protein